jgi:hypothetical protein
LDQQPDLLVKLESSSDQSLLVLSLCIQPLRNQKLSPIGVQGRVQWTADERVEYKRRQRHWHLGWYRLVHTLLLKKFVIWFADERFINLYFNSIFYNINVICIIKKQFVIIWKNFVLQQCIVRFYINDDKRWYDKNKNRKLRSGKSLYVIMVLILWFCGWMRLVKLIRLWLLSQRTLCFH